MHGLCRRHLEDAGLIGCCPHCGRQFIQPAVGGPYRYCSNRCTCRANAQVKMTVPRDRARLERLYVHDHLSLRVIARRFHSSTTSVHRALRAVGIPRRPPGYIPRECCVEAGCRRPTFKNRQKGTRHGSRRCRFHTRLREAAYHARYRREAEKELKSRQLNVEGKCSDGAIPSLNFQLSTLNHS
jgi:hypothetical protein